MKKTIVFLFPLIYGINLSAQITEEKMDELISAYASESGFNGVVFVAQKGHVLFQKGYGYKNAEEKIVNDANTIFQIGSITKQFTAAIIMQLQQEKKLSVKDKLSKYYPDYPGGDKITIENLLTHTSGIYNYTNDTNLMKSDVTRHFSEDQVLATFRDKTLNFEPGSSWEYSNSAYSLLGYIIQKVTQKPYEQVMRERILQPLQMANSGFDFTHLNDKNKAKGYFSIQPGKSVPAPVVDSTIAYSAGALYSTVADLYKWERAIYTNKILSPESWKTTFTPFQKKYGYGWGIDTMYGKNYTAHSGGIHGFSSYLIRFPEDELAIIALSNSSSGVGKLSRGLAAIVYEQPYEIPNAKAEAKLDTSLLQQYVGEYKLSPAFSLIITLQGTQLSAQATGQGSAEIYPQNENFFFYKIVDAQIEFEKDGNGKVKSLILHQNGMKMKGEKLL